MLQATQPSKTCPSDWTDAPWTLVAPRLPAANASPRGGRPRQIDLRAVRTTIRYRHRRGCSWHRLPHDRLPKSPVSDSCAQWRDDGTWTKVVTAWRAQTRVAAGREPTPRAVWRERPSVNTTELGGSERGDDGGTTIKGRKCPRVVDTPGRLVAVRITSAGLG